MTSQAEEIEKIDKVSSGNIGVNLQEKILQVYSQFEEIKTKKIRGEYGKWEKTHEIAMKLIKLQELFAKKDGYRSTEADTLIKEINESYGSTLIDIKIDQKKKLDPAKVQEMTRIVSSHYDLITSKMTELSKRIQHDMQQLDILASLFQQKRTEVETILSHMSQSR